jgi:sugar phosphate isomerase/epimerase
MSKPKNITLAISHYLCPASMSLIEFLNLACQNGFTGIGLTVRALKEMPLAQLRQELRARALSVSSVNTAGYFFEPWDPLTNQSELNRWLLDAAAELESTNGVNLIVGSSTTMPLDQARKIALDRSAELALEAKSRGTRLLLEPMHPMQARGKGCVNTLQQAAQWLREIPELSLNVDLFHSWWDPDLQSTLDGQLGKVAVVQICDVIIDPLTNLSRRSPLGEGFLDWQHFSQRALAACADLPIELEWFADQMPERDTLAMLINDARLMHALKGAQG